MRRWWPVMIVGIRVFLGLVFFSAGMAKLMHGQFPGLIGPVWLEEKLAPFGLALYSRFVAYSQVIIGLLLLTQRFATLGAIMALPLILNIFMVTVSLEWRGTPYVNFFLIVLNLILLAADFHKLKFILSDDPQSLAAQPLNRRSPKTDKLWVLGVVLILTGLQFYHYSLLANYLFVISGLLIFILCPILDRRRTVAHS